MSSRGSFLRAVASLSIGAWLVTTAAAQTARSGSGANAQLLQQLQQIASDRTVLQAENARMKKELDELRRERDALKQSQQALSARVKSSETAFVRSSADKETAEKEAQQLKDRMQELIGKFRETAQTLHDVELDRSGARQTLALREQELRACTDHNAALYKLNAEVLDRLEHQSIWSRAARAEPFTKIKRVQLENLIEDYRSRAQDELVKAALPSPPAAPAPTPPSSGPVRPD